MDRGWIWAAAAFLGLCSIWDIKYRRLPVWLLALGLAAGILVGGIRTGIGAGLFMGLIPGALLRLLAAFCPGRIGEGDGWMLMAVGVMGGFVNGVFILEAGLLLMLPQAFYYGCIRRRRHYELPLAPFLLGGCLCRLLF